jgi:hypothetical protein
VQGHLSPDVALARLLIGGTIRDAGCADFVKFAVHGRGDGLDLKLQCSNRSEHSSHGEFRKGEFGLRSFVLAQRGIRQHRD